MSSMMAELIGDMSTLSKKQNPNRLPENALSSTRYEIREGINGRKANTVGEAYDFLGSTTATRSSSILGMCCLG